MAYGFEIGRVYNRRADLHGRLGGQQQGGIITPSKHPVVVIVTGEAGQQHGYSDRQRPDGVFEYFGEGQIGDMQLVRGNLAIATHAEAGKDLLMFQKEGRRGIRYMGEWVCGSFRWETGADTQGDQRRAIVFELTPLVDIAERLDYEDDPSTNRTLEELRRRARSAANAAPGKTTAMRSVYERSRDVRDYVVARAAGHCECCGMPAPFVRPNGVPYLEPHHLRRLADGGPDDPRFVIAACPTCHRRVHCGADGKAYNTQLLAKMSSIEPG